MRRGECIRTPGRAWVGLAFIATVVTEGCITEPPLKVRGNTQPPALGDGWAVASPSSVGFDDDKLQEAVDLFYSDSEFRNVVSLLVVRDGKLVLEAYARSPSDRDVKRNIQSVTKSVTSLMFGIARGHGDFQDLDQTLYSILPQDFDEDVAKRAITLRHLLTMRSGIGFDNDDFTTEMLMDRPRNQARYILHKPLVSVPGSIFYYRDADAQLISSAFEAVTGQSLLEVASGSLFAALGIEDFFWEANVDGTSLGAIALFLRPRDLAKLGQLALQRGRWGGAQVVPEDWIDASTTVQSTTDDPEFDYGYYWWIVPELDAFTAWGHGGQFIFVVPSFELVVALTSLPSVDDDSFGTTLPRFLPLARKIIASIETRDPGWPYPSDP